MVSDVQSSLNKKSNIDSRLVLPLCSGERLSNQNPMCPFRAFLRVRNSLTAFHPSSTLAEYLCPTENHSNVIFARLNPIIFPSFARNHCIPNFQHFVLAARRRTASLALA